MSLSYTMTHLTIRPLLTSLLFIFVFTVLPITAHSKPTNLETPFSGQSLSESDIRAALPLHIRLKLPNAAPLSARLFEFSPNKNTVYGLSNFTLPLHTFSGVRTVDAHPSLSVHLNGRPVSARLPNLRVLSGAGYNVVLQVTGNEEMLVHLWGNSLLLHPMLVSRLTPDDGTRRLPPSMHVLFNYHLHRQIVKNDVINATAVENNDTYQGVTNMTWCILE